MASSTNSIKTVSSKDLQRMVTNERELSPIDIEIKIQTDRFSAIFEDAIRKADVANFLLLLTIEDVMELKKMVKKNDIALIESYFDNIDYKVHRYLKNNKITAYQPIRDSDIKHAMHYPEQRPIPDISTIINVLLKYYKQIKKLLDNKKAMSQNILSPDLLTYRDLLVKFIGKMMEKMSTSAADKLKKEVLLKNLSKTNRALKIRVSDVTKALKQEQNKFENAYKNHDFYIKKYNECLDTLLKESRDVIKKVIVTSQKQMTSATENHKSALEMLSQQEQDCIENYKKTLHTNLEHEQKLRAKRIKVEAVLTSWLQKYDTEIGDKQATLDELTENYEHNVDQSHKLKARLDEQEVVYIPLMEEKEAEYQEELRIKMTTFLMEHAARVIQRAWREILAARADKRRKRMASKKKKK